MITLAGSDGAYAVIEREDEHWIQEKAVLFPVTEHLRGLLRPRGRNMQERAFRSFQFPALGIAGC